MGSDTQLSQTLRRRCSDGAVTLLVLVSSAQWRLSSARVVLPSFTVCVVMMTSPAVILASSTPSSLSPASASPPAAHAVQQGSSFDAGAQPTAPSPSSSSPSSTSDRSLFWPTASQRRAAKRLLEAQSSSSSSPSSTSSSSQFWTPAPERLLEAHPPSVPASRQLFFASRTPFCLLSFMLPADRALAVSEQLVLLELAAKVSLLHDALTVFRRHGAMYRNTEKQLLVRTRHALVGRVREAVATLSKLECGWDLTETAVSGGDRQSLGRLDDSTCSIDEAAPAKQRRRRINSALSALPSSSASRAYRESLFENLDRELSKLESNREPPSLRKCPKHRKWRKGCAPSCPFKPALSRQEMDATRDSPVMATSYSEAAGSA